jgi:hypothetical protein
MMPKAGLRKQHIRARIAHLAARIMVEDGVTNFSSAKRKAARMAGAEDTRNLPNNDEIEQALRQQQRLFHDSEHSALIDQMRTQALSVMHMLKDFHPHLTGPVLEGYAGKYSTVQIQLFAESVKDIEIFLMNHELRYEAREVRLCVGDEMQSVSTYKLEVNGFDVSLTVLSYSDLRRKIKQTMEGKPLEKASISQVETLLLLKRDDV